MCLTHLNFDAHKIFPVTSTIKVYKVLNLNEDNKLESINNVYIWKPGFNHFLKYERMTKERFSDIYKEVVGSNKINHGLHVYLSKKTATKAEGYGRNVVVEFIADIDDFVAHGLNNGEHRGAVFTKLYLSHEEYNRVTRR